MEINLTNLDCTRLSETAFRCIAEQPSTPAWFYPVVLACFAMALVILVLVARLFFGKPRRKRERREDFVNESERQHVSKARSTS